MSGNRGFECVGTPQKGALGGVLSEDFVGPWEPGHKTAAPYSRGWEKSTNGFGNLRDSRVGLDFARGPSNSYFVLGSWYFVLGSWRVVNAVPSRSAAKWQALDQPCHETRLMS